MEVASCELGHARESVQLGAGNLLLDSTSEQGRRNAEVRAAGYGDAGRLSFGRRAVDGALAGDDQVAAERGRVEADEVEHEARPVDELAAEGGERRTETAGSARARQLGVRREGCVLSEATLELVDVFGGCALLRSEGTRRTAVAEQRVAHVARRPRRDRELADDFAQARAAVDCGAPAEADEELSGPGFERGRDQLAKPSARRTQRVELVGREEGKADRLRGFDDGGAVAEHQPAGAPWPAERVGHRCFVPRAAEDALEHLGRSFAAVRDRQLDHRRAHLAGSPGESARGVDGAEDALEARGCGDDVHGAVRGTLGLPRDERTVVRRDSRGVVVEQLDLLHLGHAKVLGAWLIEGDEPAVVDPGPASCVAELRAGLARHGLDVRDLRHVLLTHIHLDHAGVTGTLVRENPSLRVHVSEIGAPHVVDPSRLERSARRLYGDRFDELWGELAPVPQENVDVLGGRVLDFDVLAGQGHASHHVVFARGDGAVFTGDAAGVRVVPAQYVAPVSPPPDVDLEAWELTIRGIAARRPERLLLAHFGAVEDVEAHLAALRRNLAAWAQRVRDGMSVEEFEVAAEHELEDGADPGTAGAYRGAAPFWQSWQGLRRYWDKQLAE